MIETMFLHRRHARRYRQIVRVLLAHGLGGIIAPFDPRGKQDAEQEHEESADRVARRRAVHLRRAFEELGPTFVKLGQILSTRADLLPLVYIEELEKLQDAVAPDDAGGIQNIVERELGDDIETLFASFELEPLAAASIGQVHAATLHDGRQVVVKVQRPNVDRIILQDLFILADVARIAEQRSAMLRGQDISGLIREFSWTIRTELDYGQEARNIERFGRAFSKNTAIRIPAVIRELTTSRVLVMERVDGIPIDDVKALVAAGHDTVRLVEAAIQMLAEGILDIGLFHADPHPGNFVVDAQGALVVYDFGIVGSIDDRLRERLLLLALACAERDATRVVDEIAQLGVVPPGWERKGMERDISHLLAQYVGAPLESLPLQMIVTDVMDMMRRHRLRLPSELALLAKTATMAESLARTLDPDLNVIELVDPTIRRAMKRFYSADFWKDKLRLRPLEVALLAVALPGHIQRILTRIDRNDLSFQVRYEQLPETIRGLNSMVNRLALAILCAAGMIGLAMLYLAVHPTLATWHGWVFGAALVAITGMTLWVLIRIRGSGG
jgi:ubiquinone biosynthesis protein